MYKEINMILGERVKSSRWKKEITREVLAEKISVSPRFLADVESGKIGVSIQTLKSLSLSLNVSTDYLLGIEHEEEESLLPFIRLLEEIDKKYFPLIESTLEHLKALSQK